MYSVNWVLLSLVLMWVVPRPFCTPVQETESDQNPGSEELMPGEQVSNETLETETGGSNVSTGAEDSQPEAEEPNEHITPVNESSGHEEAITEELKHPVIPETSEESAPKEEGTRQTEHHSANEVDHTKATEKALASLAESETEIGGANMPITTEHAPAGTAEYRPDAKTIVRLLGQLLSKLDAPPLEWNDYQYITALKNSDGSIYLPKHHRQSTRKHLTTLLGFAEEIVVSKNALAHLDLTEAKTTVAPPNSDSTDEKVKSDHEATEPVFSQKTGDSSKQIVEQSKDKLNPENSTDEHETLSPNVDTDQFVSERSIKAQPTPEEQSVSRSNTERLIWKEVAQSTEFVKEEGKSEEEKEENPSIDYDAKLGEKEI